MVKCRRCERKNSKWEVIKRFPLQDISNNLPEELRNLGFQEFYCVNIIRKREFNQNIESVCRNNIIIRKHN